jgi:catechol 2,3-dioxygenase-like lactoylglutathione lyase family enzyme
MFQGPADVFVPVRDLHRAVEWYDKTLRFARLWEDEAHGSAGMSTGNPVGLCLVQAAPFKPLEFPPNDFGVEFGFNLATADVEAAHARLADSGVDVEEITPSFDGTFQCFAFRDPDGNKWSVVQAPEAH